MKSPFDRNGFHILKFKYDSCSVDGMYLVVLKQAGSTIGCNNYTTLQFYKKGLAVCPTRIRTMADKIIINQTMVTNESLPTDTVVNMVLMLWEQVRIAAELGIDQAGRDLEKYTTVALYMATMQAQ